MTSVMIIDIIGAENYHARDPDDWYLKMHYAAMIRLKIKHVYID